jgi:hypothetical protein
MAATTTTTTAVAVAGSMGVLWIEGGSTEQRDKLRDACRVLGYSVMAKLPSDNCTIVLLDRFNEVHTGHSHWHPHVVLTSLFDGNEDRMI